MLVWVHYNFVGLEVVHSLEQVSLVVGHSWVLAWEVHKMAFWVLGVDILANLEVPVLAFHRFALVVVHSCSLAWMEV